MTNGVEAAAITGVVGDKCEVNPLSKVTTGRKHEAWLLRVGH